MILWKPLFFTIDLAIFWKLYTFVFKTREINVVKKTARIQAHDLGNSRLFCFTRISRITCRPLCEMESFCNGTTFWVKWNQEREPRCISTMIVILHKPNLISLRLDFRRHFLLCLWPLYLQPILHFKSKSRRLRPNPILLLRLLSKVHFTNRQHWHCHCRLKRIRMSIFFNLRPQNPHLGNDHLTWKGGLWFFSKKIFWFPMLLKKIFWFWWRKKK